MKQLLCIPAMLFWITITGCSSIIKHNQTAFITQMTSQYQFDQGTLTDWFGQAEIKDDILKKIAQPSETLPWHQYRRIFLTAGRIDEGVKFWQDNEAVLAATEQKYGIPSAIIVALLGVETRYGQHTGKYRVIDALATLAFAYPPRSPFFRGELAQFLILCREQGVDPLTLRGSYAGAMGIPQFMPSSFRHYAVDFNNDHRSDIWHNLGDTIASVANYLALNHWQRDQAIALAVMNTKQSSQYKNKLSQGLKPDLAAADLTQLDLQTTQTLPMGAKVKLMAFAGDGGEELWAGLDNFYAITRYNQSPSYALVVYQLSQAISEKRRLSITSETKQKKSGMLQ